MTAPPDSPGAATIDRRCSHRRRVGRHRCVGGVSARPGCSPRALRRRCVRRTRRSDGTGRSIRLGRVRGVDHAVHRRFHPLPVVAAIAAGCLPKTGRWCLRRVENGVRTSGSRVSSFRTYDNALRLVIYPTAQRTRVGLRLWSGGRRVWHVAGISSRRLIMGSESERVAA